MERIVAGRTHLSDLINGAIEALVAASYELPTLSTLRRLAGNVHARVTDAWLALIGTRLSPVTRRQLGDSIPRVFPTAIVRADSCLVCAPQRPFASESM